MIISSPLCVFVSIARLFQCGYLFFKKWLWIAIIILLCCCGCCTSSKIFFIFHSACLSHELFENLFGAGARAYTHGSLYVHVHEHTKPIRAHCFGCQSQRQTIKVSRVFFRSSYQSHWDSRTYVLCRSTSMFLFCFYLVACLFVCRRTHQIFKSKNLLRVYKMRERETTASKNGFIFHAL